MEKLTIKNAEEALALTGKKLPDVSEIVFKGFPVSDEIIASLCNFIRNNQNLSSLDLRECLELNNTQLGQISANIREHNHSLRAIAFPKINTIFGGLGDNLGKKQQQELFNAYKEVLGSANPDFSESNQMNFSLKIPSKISEIMEVLLRNNEIATLPWRDKSVEYNLLESSSREIDPTTLIRLFNEYKMEKQKETATPAAVAANVDEGDQDYVVVDDDFGVTAINENGDPEEPLPAPAGASATKFAGQEAQQAIGGNP